MNNRPDSRLPGEAELLNLYRETAEAPPAALDARILAAARQAVAERPQPWYRRLLAALSQPRHSLAFASLAAVALTVGLLGRDLLEKPDATRELASDGPAVMASAPVMERFAEQAEPRELARALPAPAPQMKSAPAVARVAPPNEMRFELALEEIRNLQADGRLEEARERLAQLREDYPQRRWQPQLEALQRSLEPAPAATAGEAAGQD